MSNRNPFDDIPDLVPAAPAPRPAPQPMSNAPALPPIEAPKAAPSDPPGPIDFGAAFDLDVVPKAAPVPAFTPSQAPPHQPIPSAPPSHPGASHPGAHPGGPSRAPQYGPSGAPPYAASGAPMAPSSNPGVRSGPPIPAAPSSHPGFAPASDPGLGEEPAPSQRAPLVTREQLQGAAKRAGEVSREVAGKVAGATKDVAVAAALRSVGHNEEKSIRIEDPSTWLKPMLGPIIALGVAIVFTIVAMVAGVSWLRYIAIVFVLAAIGFGVVRWIKLQADN